MVHIQSQPLSVVLCHLEVVVVSHLLVWLFALFVPLLFLLLLLFPRYRAKSKSSSLVQQIHGIRPNGEVRLPWLRADVGRR